jgi:periodic tryptophan protein 1
MGGVSLTFETGADDSVDGEDQEESDEDEEKDGDDDDEDMDQDEDVEMDEKPKAHDPNDLSAFKMDEYDEESTGVGTSSLLDWTELMVAMGAFANVKGLSFYRDNNEDPYITLKEVNLFPRRR